MGPVFSTGFSFSTDDYLCNFETFKNNDFCGQGLLYFYFVNSFTALVLPDAGLSPYISANQGWI